MKSTWKMFGLWICGYTIIPCYYDFVRYFNNLKFFIKYRRKYVNFGVIWYRWSCLFNTSLKKL